MTGTDHRGQAGRPRRWWVPLLAATSVAAVALAIAVPRFQGHSESGGAAAEASYLVRDGDRVEVTGLVIAAPGRPVVYCPPLPTTGDLPEAAPRCSANFAVTLTGADLDR